MKRLILIISLLLGQSGVFAEGARYLVITHDDFYDAIQPLAQWKHKKGLKTKITKISEISSPIPESLRSYIRNACLNWNPRPEYVPLVGDQSRIPFWELDWIYLLRTDNPYADTNGITQADWETLADIFLGRLPCSTVQQCEVMVKKIFSFERWPYRAETLWFRKGNTIRADPGPLHNSGVYFVREKMLAGEYIGVDTLRSPQHSLEDLIDSLNDGRNYVLYTGHGTGAVGSRRST